MPSVGHRGRRTTAPPSAASLRQVVADADGRSAEPGRGAAERQRSAHASMADRLFLNIRETPCDRLSASSILPTRIALAAFERAPAPRRGVCRRRSAPGRRPAGRSPPPPPRSPPRASSSSSRRVFSAIAATLAGRAGSEIRSCSSTSSRQRRDRVAREALDLGRARLVAEHEEVRRGAVDQPERDARVGRVHERRPGPRRRAARPALRALDDEPLGRAGEEVRDDGVDGDAPARRSRSRSGRSGRTPTSSPALARLEVELERRPSSSRSRSRSRP